MDNTAVTSYPFLAGGGEMGERTRRYDWSSTPLGLPDQWPLSLRTTVGIVLHSAFPMFLFWGRDLLCFYNDAYRASLGESGKHPALGKRGVEVWPEIWDFIGPMIDQVMASGESTFFKDQLVPIYRNGQLEDVYWTFSYSPAYGDNGQISGVFVACTETTAEVAARLLARRNQQQLYDLLIQAPVAIAIFRGPEHVIELANEAHLNIWGRRLDEVIDKPLFDALPEVKGQGYEELLANVMTTGEPFYANELHAPMVRNGILETVYFNFVYQPLRELDGTITGVIVVANEITEQVIARQEVEESERRFKSLIYEAPVATCLLVGTELRIDVANDIILSYWGKSKAVLGLPLAQALPELDGQPFLDILADAYRSGEPYIAQAAPASLEIDGVIGTYYFDFTYKPLRDSTGAVYAIMIMAVDVTEQVLSHRQLEESEGRYRRLSTQLDIQVQHRTEELAASNEELAATNEELAATNEELMASNEEGAAANEELLESNTLLIRSNDNLEKFAYVASHDLQEPLRKILSFGDLLKSQYGSQLGAGVDHLERMQSAANRMSTLIRDLLTFSRIATQRETAAPVALNDAIDAVLNDLDLRIQETGAVVTVAPLPTVQGDRQQLEQLFQNLISNALKFRRADVSPVLQISSQLVTYGQIPLAVKPARSTKMYYRINVADNGIGFDEKYLDRIFQVFQRLNTKSQYTGTGIGLAICEKVATNHGGAITASSQPGQGATFSVYLPQ